MDWWMIIPWAKSLRMKTTKETAKKKNMLIIHNIIIFIIPHTMHKSDKKSAAY